MRVLFDIGHPAHVHFFKNTIYNLKKDGHEVKITARNKEVTLALLQVYGLEYENRGAIYTGLLNKAFGMIKIDWKLFLIAKKFKPDLLAGVHNPYVAHVGAILRKPVIIFTDTENVKIASFVTYPFVQTIITPTYFRDPINPKKHIKIHGIKEIAYLHPNFFTPDPHVLKELGLNQDEKFIILRFISWGASHDIELKGIQTGTEKDLIKTLSQYGKIFITSEKPLMGELEQYRLNIPPEKIHSLLYYAQLYIGEGGTMAVEAAILGTPAIHIESTKDGRASGEMYGNFLELRDKFQLLFFYPTQDLALYKAVEILENLNSKKDWQEKQKLFWSSVIDVTTWLTDFIEGYPESFYQYKKENRKSK
jgi:predicted glycosyltransferase